MKKTYKVKNRRKTPRKYMPVGSVGEYLASLSAFGEKTMFVWKEKDGLHEMSFSAFVELTEKFGRGLVSRFGCGTHIAIMGETSPYWIAAYLGIIASGGVAIPMDKELAPEEVSGFLKTAGASAVVCSEAFEKQFAETAASHPFLRTVISYGSVRDANDAEAKPDCDTEYSAVLSDGEKYTGEFTPDDDRERCCELLFTSGTTGTSKCVMLSQKNVFSVVTAADEATCFNEDDVLVSVLPLHHTYELACTLAACNYGAKICINDSLRHVLRSFKEYKPTGLILVPMFITTMYKKILAEAKRSGKDRILDGAAVFARVLGTVGLDMSEKLFGDVRDTFGGRLEKIICGGAPLNPELIEIFDAFGIPIYEGYGITECAPLVAVTPYYRRRPGSVGPAVQCCEVRIEGSELNDDGYLVGEIQVRGDNVMLGYLGNDEANEAAFTDDGWFRTGDVGYKDKEGYLFITGRMKSVIVLDNGKNVFPEEIEEYLETIDEICESVVVGREDEEGMHLTAVIFPNYAKYPDYDENEIRAEIQKKITALNKKLPSFKQLHKLDFRKTEFEKTTTKKIKRHLVK